MRTNYLGVALIALTGSSLGWAADEQSHLGQQEAKAATRAMSLEDVAKKVRINKKALEGFNPPPLMVSAAAPMDPPGSTGTSSTTPTSPGAGIVPVRDEAPRVSRQEAQRIYQAAVRDMQATANCPEGTAEQRENAKERLEWAQQNLARASKVP